MAHFGSNGTFQDSYEDVDGMRDDGNDEAGIEGNDGNKCVNGGQCLHGLSPFDEKYLAQLAM